MKNNLLIYALFISFIASCASSKSLNMDLIVSREYNVLDSLHIFLITDTLNKDKIGYNVCGVNGSKRKVVLPKLSNTCLGIRFTNKNVSTTGTILSPCYTIGGTFEQISPTMKKKLIEQSPGLLADSNEFFFLYPLDTASYVLYDSYKYRGLDTGYQEVELLFAPDKRYKTVAPFIWTGSLKTKKYIYVRSGI